MAFRILADATSGFSTSISASFCSWSSGACSSRAGHESLGCTFPAAGWGAWVEFAGWVCPLTPLENWLRQQGGGPAYTASFIEHYIVPILYPLIHSRASFSGDWVTQWSWSTRPCICWSFAVALGRRGLLPNTLELTFLLQTYR